MLSFRPLPRLRLRPTGRVTVYVLWALLFVSCARVIFYRAQPNSPNTLVAPDDVADSGTSADELPAFDLDRANGGIDRIPAARHAHQRMGINAPRQVKLAPFELRDSTTLRHQRLWKIISDSFKEKERIAANDKGPPVHDVAMQGESGGNAASANAEDKKFHGPHLGPPLLNLSVTELANGLTLLPDDVVVCISATEEKIDAIARVRAAWAGPAVVGMYCRDFACVDGVYDALPQLLGHTHNTAVVVVLGDRGSMYPLNAMRNIVADYVPGGQGYGVFTLDADMLLSEGAYELVRRAYVDAKHTRNPREPRLLVVPCFEFGADSYDVTAAAERNQSIPRTKNELIVAGRRWIRPSKIKYYPQGQSCTEYKRWFLGNDVSPWKQTTFNWEYEPFFIVNKTASLPGYDEYYVFYGGDKQSYSLLLWAAGCRFYTIPNVFSVHMPHPDRRRTATTEEDVQLDANRRYFMDFRTEIGVRFHIPIDKFEYKMVGMPSFKQLKQQPPPKQWLPPGIVKPVGNARPAGRLGAPAVDRRDGAVNAVGVRRDGDGGGEEALRRREALQPRRGRAP